MDITTPAYYIGITIRGSHPSCLTDIKHENGILYVRKGSTPEELLVPAHELESFKSKIRRLDIDVYNRLNDDFGMHRLAGEPGTTKEKPIIRLKKKTG
jgi:hypothetical protein